MVVWSFMSLFAMGVEKTGKVRAGKKAVVGVA
jgi:hypothetical protein